jgi:predicted RecB family nuclease
LSHFPWHAPDGFSGRADFLVKSPGQSRFGSFQYEIWDTKLSQVVKASAIIQLCCYADMLIDAQGVLPKDVIVLLGNGEAARHKTKAYFDFYQRLKKTFISFHHSFDERNMPSPAESKHWGRWSTFAESILKKMDHLSLVATMTRNQIKWLYKADINTMTDLAMTRHTRVKGLSNAVFERLKAQAAIQIESEGCVVPKFAILPQQEGIVHGLAILPPHSTKDIFFDIEGFPLVDGGMEYLWGVSFFDDSGQRAYIDFWAHTHEEEKKAFEQFIQFAYTRWQEDPHMHIYHYANYEIAACRKLMGKYGVCEYEVDQLLRNEVFVDLYKVVKTSLIIGEPRYSIKNIEHLYRSHRETKVGSGSDSVVAYENWRNQPDGQSWQTSAILKHLRDYNRDDCDSTQELVDWLRLQQQEHDITFIGQTDVVEPELKDEVNETITLRDRLFKHAADLRDRGLQEDGRIYDLFAWSLEFHRRESKPVFWRLFDRLALPEDELFDDIDCLSHCVLTDKPPFKPTERARNLAYEYAFNPNQECKAHASRYYVLGQHAQDGKQKTVTLLREESDFRQGRLVVTQKEPILDVVTLIPDEYVNPTPIPAAIFNQAKALIDGELTNSALLDFLYRKAPKIIGLEEGSPIASSTDSNERLKQIVDAVVHLDSSYLTIQGPPGAGKSYTGKHIITELIKLGKKVGIASNSHKAINHLLMSTRKYCIEEGIDGYFACTKSTEEDIEQLGIHVLKNTSIASNLQPGCVIGTTAWGFSREDLKGEFDVLIIDEAGQVSVANLIAMSQSTQNIVLMGDQMQLG